ncbi:GatB/YqeY domain-containing protein [Thermovirga sp.]|uniref:GatB/YqeY domain-containing protein n=1 Tax=Thermovirga sp. TaxID=2699834 RepID=UPI0025EE2E01|nr:GatB/YqeY domain-containing protein [Thermovirga sp.]MBO8153443.1 GatB/YqeY domain-containing protein [Thermovirga sp.]
MKEFEKKIQQDFVDALKKGDTKVVDVLRMLKSSIQNKKVEKGKDASLSEDDYIVLLRRMIKQRKEAAEQYEAVGVRDRAEQERAEVSILEKYLPEQLSEEQILQLAKKIIEETGAKGISDLGKVMGKLMPHVKGKADGATVRNVVERLLR